jgi:hypothetical protein
MPEIDVWDFDFLAGVSAQAQRDAQVATADASTVVVGVGTTAQIVGFDSGGNPQPKSVGGNGNGVTLAFSGNTLQANADQDLKTTGSVTFGGLKVGASGTTITFILTASATLDFPNTAAQQSSDLTIAVTGAAVGNPVFLAIPAAPDANACFTAWVSAADVVSVRFNNYSAGAIDPASGTYRVVVFKF